MAHRLIFKPSFRGIHFRNELFAGFTVAMTMIPESLSFAILAGISPIIGLYAAFIMGIVTAILGGRPGMVSGGAGATIVVLIALISTHGIDYLLATVILAGVLQISVGLFKLGKFIRLIPQPVMYGFLNGLAVIIFMAQVEQFKVMINGQFTWLTGSPLYLMIGLTLLTASIVYLFPKLTRFIPSSLVAIIVVSLGVYFFDIDTKKVIDIAAVSGGLPTFRIPAIPFNLETLTIVFPYAVIMASVGLIESLLTLNMVDELTQSKGKPNKESIAQGVANMLNGFFGGMGGCAMVAQTLVNLNAGAKTRLSAIIGALSILVIILFGGPIIEQIPMAALVGVMMMVALGTFQWVTFRLINKMPKSDIMVGITVALITIFIHNLALAVLVGVLISALVFAWDHAKRLRIDSSINQEGHKIYQIHGPLFFGSCQAFTDNFNYANDPEVIYIDFRSSKIIDMSALEALKKVIDHYAQINKHVILIHLDPQSSTLIHNTKGYIDVEIN